MNTKQMVLTALLVAITLTVSLPLLAQVKIGSAPTIISPNNNLEVEASTTGRKTSIDKVTGQVTIADGTQGDGKILTSDVNGGASWQPAPGSVVITGNNNSPASVAITPPTTLLIPDCPITLNKGIYELYYYAQYDYNVAADPTTPTTLVNTWPRFIYFEFTTVSGAASFPSYRWIATGLNNGPHVIPSIAAHQVAAKVQQIAIVTADNTIIKPKFFGIGRVGTVQNIGPIVAVKM